MASSPTLSFQDRLVFALGGLLMAVGFAADVRFRSDLASGALYLLPVVLGLLVSWRPYPLVAWVVTTGLLVVAGVARDELSWSSTVVLERAILALTLGGVAAVVRFFNDRLRQSTARTSELADLKRAIDHAAIVATTDVKGCITYVNDKFCEISGYTRDELIGQDHRIINSRFHPPEFIRDLWRTIASGTVWHGEVRNRSKDGRFYWVDTTIVPFVNERGLPHQYIAIRADITARKAAEERLVQQAALAHMGQMAAVMAHEVRNPLAGIKGAFQVLMSRREPGDSELPVMREAVLRIDALSSLIDDVMTFARPRPPRVTRVDLRQLARDAVSTVQNDPAWQGVECSVSGEEVPADVDPELVRAALLNLLLNAAQAMNGKGRVEVVLSSGDGHTLLDVRDSGPGIPPDVLARVFEPFFTTKTRGGGLGLAIAKRTAELHGGDLHIYCPAAGGTYVSLTLPEPTPSVGPEGPDARQAPGPAGPTG